MSKLDPVATRSLSRLRQRWLSCKSKAEALALALHLIRRAENTVKGKQCNHCQLPGPPAPNCVVVDD